MRRVQRWLVRWTASGTDFGRRSWARVKASRIGPVTVVLALLVGVVPGAVGGRSSPDWWTVRPDTVATTLAPGTSFQVDKQVRTPVVPPRPDVVLLVDGTISMAETIGKLRTELGTITKTVRDEQPDSWFAVAKYGDVTDGEKAFTVLQGLTDNLKDVQEKGVDQLKADLGGSSPPVEDWINALWQIAQGGGGKTAFREGSSPVVVLIGDASSHDPSLGHTLDDAIGALTGRKARVVAVDIDTPVGDGLDGDGRPKEPHEPNQGSKVANGTGGTILKGVDPKRVADKIVEGLTNLPTTVSHRTTGCDPALTVALEPATQKVTSGATVEFKETITAASDAPQGQTLQCTVQFLMDGKVPGGNTRMRDGAVPEPVPDYHERISVAVRDVEAPRVTVDDRTVEATGKDGVKIDYVATANDAVDGDVPVTCTPAPGSLFPMGTTHVTCTATDSAGNKGTDTATFIVNDASAPQVTVDDRMVEATGKDGAKVDYVATAKDAVDGDLPVTCVPASGSLFPLGTTEVSCTATDSAGNRGTDTATFTVLPAPIPVEADVAVTANVTPVPNYVGRTTEARFTLTNAGPRVAEGVVLAAEWPGVTDASKRAVGRLSACGRDNPCSIPVGGRLTVTQPAVYSVPVSGDVRASVRGALRDPAQGNNTAVARIRVLQPKLTITPEVGPPGQVVQARGRDFPPGSTVRLTWKPGITAARSVVRVGRDGSFEAQVLVLRKDRLGPRELRAEVRGLDGLQRPFLVVQRNLNPPDFAGRS
ncbi:HYR domain-containing protein [Streptomyces netropsis]|uniref:HYR domain-containing protein n=1 Tax=Streptomyces netropsis TaxID=55404 RepID=UPI0030D3CF74